MKLRSFLLGIYFFSLPFENWAINLGFWSGSISMIISIVYFLSIIPLFMEIPIGMYNKYKRYIIPLVVFFTYLTLINIINRNHINSHFFNSSIFFNIILLIVMLAQAYYDPKVIHKALYYYLSGTIILSVLYYLNIGVEYEVGRVILLGNNANALGAKIAIGIIIILNEIIIFDYFNLKLRRLLLLLPLPIMFLLLIGTGSRLALISLFVSFLVSIFIAKTKISIKILLIILAFILSIVVINIIGSNYELNKRFESVFVDGDTSGRFDIWETLWPDIKKNYVFGVGETGYSLISNKSFNKLYNIVSVQDLSPHNVLIEIILFTGLIGLTTYLFFWIRLLKLAIKVNRKYKYSTSLLLLVFILGQIIAGHLLVYKSYYALYAIIIISSHPLFHQRNKKLS